MGALTLNRKRSDEHFSFNSAISSLYSPISDSHISKKPRLSSMHLAPENSDSPKSIAYRIRQYPAPTTRLKREVHAPCRVHRFGFSATWLNRDNIRDSRPKSGEIEGGVKEMGNFSSLFNDYKLKKSSAIDTLRYVSVKEKAVAEDTVLEDSSVEEVEVIEEITGRFEENLGKKNGLVSDFRELDDGVEILENGIKPSYFSGVSDLSNVNMKLDNTRNVWDPLPPLKPGLEVLHFPDSHAKLLEPVRRRDVKLGGLNFQISLTEKLLQFLRLPSKKQDKDTSPEPFIPLTKEEEADVSNALSISNRRRVLVSHEDSNIQITGELLQCLRPGAWLNDEVINVYLELLKEREKREPKKFLRCHFFNTFFYKKLTGGNGYDYKSVRRWTTQKKLGYSLVECDKIFVPIHKAVHWCLAVINKKDQTFQYLDSLKGRDSKVLNALAKYYADEVKDKTGKNIDLTSWKHEYVKDLPEQLNGFDCGVFMIKYADFYSRGLGLCFNQGHMPYFRKRTAKEILRLKAD